MLFHLILNMSVPFDWNGSVKMISIWIEMHDYVSIEP